MNSTSKSTLVTDRVTKIVKFSFNLQNLIQHGQQHRQMMQPKMDSSPVLKPMVRKFSLDE